MALGVMRMQVIAFQPDEPLPLDPGYLRLVEYASQLANSPRSPPEAIEEGLKQLRGMSI